MKKNFIYFLTLAAAALFTFEAMAGTTFLPDADMDSSNGPQQENN